MNMIHSTLDQLEGTIRQLISFPAEDTTRLQGILNALKEDIDDLQLLHSEQTKASI